MGIAGDGVAVGVAVGVADRVVVGRGVLGRGVLDRVDAGCVLGSPPGGVTAGSTAEGSAQLGGTVGMPPTGFAVAVGREEAGGAEAGREEARAAGEGEAPDVTDGWLTGWAVGAPECPVRALAAA